MRVAREKSDKITAFFAYMQEKIGIFYKMTKNATKKATPLGCFFAVRTGLEPATPCVTGMYSNQLNYRTNFYFK